MTARKCKEEKRAVFDRLIDMQITLEYSVKLLEDYKEDIQSELKELSRTIRKGKKKLKQLTEKISAFREIDNG